MEGRFYSDVFSTAGIDLVAPRDDERAYIHEKYMGELVRGVFLPATRNRLLEIVGALRDRDAIDGVLLAGTELPLVLRMRQQRAFRSWTPQRFTWTAPFGNSGESEKTVPEIVPVKAPNRPFRASSSQIAYRRS